MGPADSYRRSRDELSLKALGDGIRFTVSYCAARIRRTRRRDRESYKRDVEPHGGCVEPGGMEEIIYQAGDVGAAKGACDLGIGGAVSASGGSAERISGK